MKLHTNPQSVRVKLNRNTQGEAERFKDVYPIIYKITCPCGEGYSHHLNAYYNSDGYVSYKRTCTTPVPELKYTALKFD